MRRIHPFTYRNSRFHICEYDGRIVGIDYKYVDEDGKLKKTLNGLQMFISDSVTECEERIMNSLDIDWYVQNGVPRYKAIMIVMNIPDELEDKMKEIMEG